MGNVFSRCAQEVRELWRNCRSRNGGRTSSPGAPKARREKEHVGDASAVKDRVPLLLVLDAPALQESKEESAGSELEKSELLPDKECDEEVIVPRIEKQELRRLYTLSEARLGSIVNQDNEGDGGGDMVRDNDNNWDNDKAEAGDNVDDDRFTCTLTDRHDQSPPCPRGDSAKARGDADVVGRQEAVLRRLSQLQTEVEKLCRVYGVQDTAITAPLCVSSPASTSTFTSPASTSKVSGPPLTRNGVPLEVVVNAHPSSPPYAVLVLCEMLAQHYEVLTSTFTHSSVSSVPQPLRQLGSPNPPSRSHQLGITLVWKQVPNGPSLMVSPQKQTAILGEANIARYLARLLNPPYDAGDPVTATQIDEWLDMAQKSLVQGSSKEQAGVLRAMNSALGRKAWLVGDQLTLADVVVWSAVQQCRVAGEAPANVKHWLQACSSHPAFKPAACILAA